MHCRLCFWQSQPWYLIKPSHDVYVSTAATSAKQSLDIQRKRQATSMHQAVEWGMWGIQPFFSWLKDTFMYKERCEHWIMMKMIVLLYNHQARTVGINQIHNVFWNQLIVDADNKMETM